MKCGLRLKFTAVESNLWQVELNQLLNSLTWRDKKINPCNGFTLSFVKDINLVGYYPVIDNSYLVFCCHCHPVLGTQKWMDGWMGGYQ